MNLSGKRILLTGMHGFLGRHLSKQLWDQGANVYEYTRGRYDLRDSADIWSLITHAEPEIIIHAAANAGGIGLNQKEPGKLFYDNAIMGIELMEKARVYEVEKFVTIGTVCEYPKYTPVPFQEKDLWGGYPEETNAAYGLAKKMLLVQGQAYRKQYGMNVIHLLPVNLYGPGDNFDPETSHVIPALIRKVLEAKEQNLPKITLWGDGSASREFLYVEDAADGITRATEHYNGEEPINIGSGMEVDIKKLATWISMILDYTGKIEFDTSKPNGQPRRCLDTTRARKEFGFGSRTSLYTGLIKTIDWYKENRCEL